MKINKHFHTRYGKNMHTRSHVPPPPQTPPNHTHTMPIKSTRTPTHTHTETNLKARARRAVIKNKREREFQIWAAVKVLLVKILFEEVSFKASFKGREEKAVVKSKRKRIQDLDSKKAKDTGTMLFSFEEGDTEGSIIQRRAQRPRRDVHLDKFS